MLTELRKSLVTQLSVIGTPVYDTWPRQFTPPGVLVIPSRSGDYVTAGQFRDSFDVSLEAIVVVPTSDRISEQSNLDAIVEEILNLPMSWAFQGVTGTGLIDINKTMYPHVAIRFATQFDFGV